MLDVDSCRLIRIKYERVKSGVCAQTVIPGVSVLFIFISIALIISHSRSCPNASHGFEWRAKFHIAIIHYAIARCLLLVCVCVCVPREISIKEFIKLELSWGNEKKKTNVSSHIFSCLSSSYWSYTKAMWKGNTQYNNQKFDCTYTDWLTERYKCDIFDGHIFFLFFRSHTNYANNEYFVVFQNTSTRTWNTWQPKHFRFIQKDIELSNRKSSNFKLRVQNWLKVRRSVRPENEKRKKTAFVGVNKKERKKTSTLFNSQMFLKLAKKLNDLSKN